MDIINFGEMIRFEEKSARFLETGTFLVRPAV